MFNLESLYSAFEIVKANHGCAGVDGVTVERFEANLHSNLKTLQKELNTNIYTLYPYQKF